MLKVTAGTFTSEGIRNTTPKNDKWNFNLIDEKIGKNNKVLPEMADSVCMGKLDKHHMISLDPLDINNAIKRKHLLPLLMALPEG